MGVKWSWPDLRYYLCLCQDTLRSPDKASEFLLCRLVVMTGVSYKGPEQSANPQPPRHKNALIPIPKLLFS